MNLRYVITGGPGAGKTTTLSSLAKSGYHCAPESARRIVKHRRAKGLPARPAPMDFGREILDSDIAQYDKFHHDETLTFFDRGILDALYMLNLESGPTPIEAVEYVDKYPYNKVVFLFPPWEALYTFDTERDQTFAESVKILEGMRDSYSQWSYKTIEVPRMEVDERASFILDTVNKNLIG
ncbi:MAG: ATP-binding protein [Nitrospirales bacterium]|nr:MAG: ATP-binding protein [Nitrospirales bacterium]